MRFYKPSSVLKLDKYVPNYYQTIDSRRDPKREVSLGYGKKYDFTA